MFMLRLGGPRSRAVLVVLGLHAGRPVMTPEIIDDLWGESAPASAAHTVETYISRLRKVLNLPGEPIVIARNGSGYVLNLDARQVDALWFAELAAKGRTALAEGDTSSAEDLLSSALALWRGPALADVRDAAFAPAAARGLENERLVVLETLIDARLLMGRHVEVLSDLESAVAAEPFRERFHAQLMTALYRSGRQVDALAAYQRARELLVGEHGLEPGRGATRARASDPPSSPGARTGDSAVSKGRCCEAARARRIAPEPRPGRFGCVACCERVELPLPMASKASDGLPP